MTTRWMVALTLITLFAAVDPAVAQRGMGDAAGVPRWTPPPPTETIAGRVSGVQVEACAQSTGWADVAAHVLLDTDDGRTLHLHLGPFDVLDDLVKSLDDGADVAALAFRSDAMPSDHYVAVTLTVDGATTGLRAEDDLHPVWASVPRPGERIEGRRMPGMRAVEAPPARARAPKVTDQCWWQPPRPGNS